MWYQVTNRGGTTDLLSHLNSKHPVKYQRMSSKMSPSSRQTLLIGSSKLCSTQCSDEATDKIVDFVALDLKLFSTEDAIGFRDLLYLLNQDTRYNPQSCKDNLPEKMRSLEMLWLPHLLINWFTNYWDLDKQNKTSLLTSTSHFITKVWKMKSAVFQTREMPEVTFVLTYQKGSGK